MQPGLLCVSADSQIGNEGAKAIADALKANEALTSLNLHCAACLC